MLLEQINSPADIRRLSLGQLSVLAQELRQYMIDIVSQSGGHLASSLGAVELIISLHYCLNTPQDKMVFDVGHQAYAHKIITGRAKAFSSLRKYEGISGFPSKTESDYDVFFTGHSSSAVSLAFGLACARRKPNAHNFRVVAVIGDGSLSGGLCFEGLNNAGHSKEDVLVVLNTNELSIAPNVGALSTYLNKLISLPVYNRFRDAFDRFLEERMPRGKRLKDIANKLEEGVKGLFIPGMLFEELGFRYFGPLNGHNFEVLIPQLKNILEIKGPKILHVVTKKGKGYPPAESDPVRFHSVGAFDIHTGIAKPGSVARNKSYTDTISQALLDCARDDPSIVAITAAMPEGTGLDKFRDAYPDRFFDVGIAEAHAVCFASGLAQAGLKPVVAIYSTFLQRALDQIIEDVALQKNAVVFIVDRASVGDDGVTHQGIFDIAALRFIPELVIMAGRDGVELQEMLKFAFTINKPVVIRYPKAFIPQPIEIRRAPLELGIPELICEGTDCTLVALGSMVDTAWQATCLLRKQGLSVTLVNARFVKPLSPGIFGPLLARTKYNFSLEEGVVDAGFGSALMELTGAKIIRMGLPNEFIAHGKRDILLDRWGLSPGKIAQKILDVLQAG